MRSNMNATIFRSATELARAIHERELTSAEVVQAHLDRIAAVNPQLNALVLLAPDALAQAQQADAELALGNVRGPLHGVPFTVKDVFATTGLASAIDQRIRRRAAPAYDAIAVARLRAAGAILLGKTNCPPNGSGSDAENAVIGRTVNPYDPTCSTGGSSGGEAALIAVGASPFGLGSDGSGGVRVPAHYCGVVGLKPTAGRIPNTGAYNQPGGMTDPRTQVGTLARSVDDLTLITPILCGPDYEDSGVIPMPWRDPAAVRPTDLLIAYFTHDPASPVTAETAHAVGAAAQALARAGVQVESARPHDLINAGRQIDDAWQDRAGAPGRTVVELYALWDSFRAAMLHFMARYDAILCPVDHHPAPPFRERDNRRFDYTVPFSMTGQPALVVRVGATASGLPVGVQIVARPWREDVALALGRLLEQELGGWQPSRL